MARIQKIVVFSTIEADYVVVIEPTKSQYGFKGS